MSPAAPVPYGQAITVSSTVTAASGPAPTGAVAFTATIAGVASSPCPAAALASGSASCTFTPAFTGGVGGRVTITAAYLGSATDAPSPASAGLAVVVNGANPLASFTISSSANPAASGAAVVLTATLTGAGPTPTGTVAFFDDGSPIACAISPARLSRGAAVCKYTPAGPGSDSITASYSGDVAYAPASPPSPYTQSVDGTTAPTSVVVSSNLNPAPNDSTITFTATVTGSSTTPSGTAAFYAKIGSNLSTICPAATVSGNGTVSTATSAVSPGDDGGVGFSAVISVVYSGDATYTTKMAAGLTQIVDGTAALSSFTVTASANPVAAGKAVTYTTHLSGDAGAPTGTVTFLDAGTPIACTVSPSKLASGAASCTTTPSGSGAHVVTVSYGGDVHYGPATTPSALTENVLGTAASTVVVSSSADPSANGASVTLTATVTGSSGTPTGAVAFSAKVGTTTTTVCAASALNGSGATATATCSYTPPVSGGAGLTATVTATYSGDASYAAKASVAFVQTVDGTAALTGFTLTSSLNPAASGKAVTYTATLTGAAATPTGTVTFLDNGSPIVCTASGTTSSKIGSGRAVCTYVPSGAGTHTITAVYSGDATYAAASTPASYSEVVQ